MYYYLLTRELRWHLRYFFVNSPQLRRHSPFDSFLSLRALRSRFLWMSSSWYLLRDRLEFFPFFNRYFWLLWRSSSPVWPSLHVRLDWPLKYFLSNLCMCSASFGCCLIIVAAANLKQSIPLADSYAFNYINTAFSCCQQPSYVITDRGRDDGDTELPGSTVRSSEISRGPFFCISRRASVQLISDSGKTHSFHNRVISSALS